MGSKYADGESVRMSTREVRVGSVHIGGKNPLALIAGPCVIEGEEHLLGIAERLQEICGKLEAMGGIKHHWVTQRLYDLQSSHIHH